MQTIVSERTEGFQYPVLFPWSYYTSSSCCGLKHRKGRWRSRSTAGRSLSSREGRKIWSGRRLNTWAQPSMQTDPKHKTFNHLNFVKFTISRLANSFQLFSCLFNLVVLSIVSKIFFFHTWIKASPKLKQNFSENKSFRIQLNPYLRNWLFEYSSDLWTRRNTAIT